MQMPRIIALALVAPLAIAAHLTASSPQVDAKVGEILAAAREALGGEAALAKVQTLSVTGATRRIMGEREIAGDVTLDFVLPDKMKRTDSFGIPAVRRWSGCRWSTAPRCGTTRPIAAAAVS